MPFADLCGRWLEEASLLRAWGACAQADVLERTTQEVQAAWSLYCDELLPVAQASEESGFSPEHLRNLVRNGRLQAARDGERGRISIRRGDLPLRPGWNRHSDSGLDEFVQGLVER